MRVTIPELPLIGTTRDTLLADCATVVGELELTLSSEDTFQVHSLLAALFVFINDQNTQIAELRALLPPPE